MENKATKIWGLYPGNLNPKVIEQLDEASIWEQIYNLGNQIYWDTEDLGKPGSKKSKEQIQEMQYALEYLMYYTKKFGVEFTKEPSSHNHIERTTSYTAWYSYWYNHFDKMSKEKYDDYVNAKFSNQDISRYMPTGSWKDVYTRIKARTK